jgi:hypothetical protein
MQNGKDTRGGADEDQELDQRDQILARLAGENVQDAVRKIAAMLAQDPDEPKRHALLSARIEILRRRTQAVRSGTEEVTASLGAILAPELGEPKLDRGERTGLTSVSAGGNVGRRSQEIEVQIDGTRRKRMRIIEECDFEGMRLPVGFIIEVEPHLAERLLEKQVAQIVDDETADQVSG